MPVLVERLQWANFKAFEGSHELVLSGRTTSRNVHLIGALNGAGKSTLVQVLLISLYGSAAAGMPGVFPTGRDFKRQYERWLANAWNHNARRNGDDEILLACNLEMEHSSVFVKRRIWLSADGSYEDEELRVEYFAHADHKTTVLIGDEAAELVVSLIPRNVAELTFFDGERVVSLDRPNAGTWIVEALDKLLSLEPVKRTRNEIDKACREKRDGLANKGQRAAMASLQQRSREHEAEQETLIERQRELRESLLEARTELSRLDDDVAAHLSGKTATSSAQARAELTELESRRSELRNRLGKQLGDWLYTDFVADLIPSLHEEATAAANLRHEQDRKENRRDAVKVFLSEALNDEWVLDILGTEDRVTDLRNRFDLFVPDDAPTQPREDVSWTESLAHDELADLKSASATLLGRDYAGTNDVAADLIEIDKRIHQVSLAVENLSEGTGLDEVIRRRDELTRITNQMQEELGSTGTSLEDLRKTLSSLRSNLSRIDNRLGDDAEASLWLEKAERLSAALGTYIHSSRAHALADLSDGVLKRLRPLLRKSSLVTSVAIEPETYEVILRDAKGNRVRLPSAGEQQLAAIAFSAAMLDLANDALPMVIDTPLARLDSVHRRNLIENLLPTAGRQVVLLSTDEEIDEGLLALMMPSVARVFRIDHDDSAGSSTIVEDEYLHFTPRVSNSGVV